MPKIQGKQIASSTITHDNLSLTTPLSTDVSKAATVEYVNNYVSNNAGTIGPAEDGAYTDGIFTDFTTATPVGTAIDRFNEMLLLLAPTPPLDNWNNTFSSLTITSTLYQTGRALTSGTPVSNITLSTTPTFSLTSTVGTLSPAQTTAKALPTSGNRTFVLIDNGSTLESEVITSSSTSNAVGYIRYTTGDPYVGISGKAGFWNGIVTFTVNGTLPSISASDSQRTLQFTHPGTDSPETFSYYVDSVLSPSVTTPTITAPTMSTYVSGVPTLSSGQLVSDVAFTLSNTVSYFYNNSMIDYGGTLINASNNNAPTTIPTLQGQQVIETGKSVSVKTGTGGSGVFSDLSWGFTVTTRNIVGTTGVGTYLSSSVGQNLRIDTVSNEASRQFSGSGSYPATGYGIGAGWDSTQSLLTGVYINELQLRNGLYTYPSVNYSAFGANLNYSAATGTRWYTTSASFTNKSNFRITFNTPTNITSATQANLLVEVKMEGSTSWVNGDVAYAGVGNPGSGADGVAACTLFTTSTREITFGTQVLSGTLYVRIGLTGTGVSFSSVSITALS